MKGIPGVDMSTGSLGQGVSCAAGMALAAKLDKATGGCTPFWATAKSKKARSGKRPCSPPTKSWTTCASWWTTTTCRSTAAWTRSNSPYPNPEKFAAFGFHVIVIDAHDWDQLEAAFDTARACKGKPTAIILHSVKGKGVSFMENQVGWHGTAPNQEQYETAMAELKAPCTSWSGLSMAEQIKKATRDSYGAAPG